MELMIDPYVLRDFPDAAIGYLVADVEVGGSGEYVESLKSSLRARLNAIGVTSTTMMDHPDVARWRDVFSVMGVKPSKYRSSLEALLRRLFKGEMWNISNVVDLYGCVSVMDLLPMGAHDLAKIKGDIILRHGKLGEKFLPLGSDSDFIDLDTRNIVYADDEKILCWLWNHRDTRDAMVTKDTKRAIFFVDCAFATEWRTVRDGLADLERHLEKIGARIITRGVVDGDNISEEIKV